MLTKKEFKRPLKHPGYNLPQRRFMTRALGFVQSSGVLLCVDTEVSTQTARNHTGKLGLFSQKWVTVGCAMAGNADFAAGAWTHLEHSVSTWRPGKIDLLASIEKTLADYYRCHVLEHPLYGQIELDYQFLLTIRDQRSKKKDEWMPQTFLTYNTSLSRMESFRCIGLGYDVGTAASSLFYRREAPVVEAIAIAMFILERVKRTVQGCGGDSRFAWVPNGSQPGQVWSETEIYKFVRDHAIEVEKWPMDLLMASMLATDEGFEKILAMLGEGMREMRAEWLQRWAKASQQAPGQTTR